jgi:hypothetical protein
MDARKNSIKRAVVKKASILERFGQCTQLCEAQGFGTLLQ